MYSMENEPKSKDYNRVIKNIMTRCRRKPEEDFLIVGCFAGHGMQKEGNQVLLFNEYDEKNKFYKLCTIEADIRILSKFYRNSYSIIIFAACREVFSLEKHCGIVGNKDNVTFENFPT